MTTTMVLCLYVFGCGATVLSLRAQKQLRAPWLFVALAIGGWPFIFGAAIVVWVVHRVFDIDDRDIDDRDDDDAT